MEHDDLCSILVETYYDAIYRYCYATLQFDEQAAQDCTQETFYLLVRKKTVLNLHGNMKVRLYKTADRVMRNYMRREQHCRKQIPLDELEIPDPSGAPDAEHETLCDRLSADEYDLLLAYYGTEHGAREQVSAKFGLSVRALYKKIDRIRHKLRLSDDTKEK